MTRTWKVAILLGIVPALSWNRSAEPAQSPHAGSRAPAGTAAGDPNASEGDSPFDGHYERTGTGGNTAEIDILQVGPGVLRVKGLATWVGNAETGNVNTGDFSGTVKPERLKARFENADGCKLDILFHAEGLKVEKTASACGGLNVTFDGEYKRTGPPKLGQAGGR
ncbi:MAG: hypothetical protein ABUT39_16310 [Acidobacteriota bacterium]